MDTEAIQELKTTLIKLYAKNKDGTKTETTDLSQEEFKNSILTLVTENVNAERFSRVQELTGVGIPVILACKSNSFWKAIEKIQNQEKSFNFVSSRKRSSKKSSSSNINKDTKEGSICGSPLKLDVIADLSVFEGDESMPTYKPSMVDCGLTQSTARQLLSLYSNLFSSLEDKAIVDKVGKIPTAVVLCDGQNLKSVSAMCLAPIFDNQNNFMAVKTTQLSSKPSEAKSNIAKLHPKFSTSSVTCKAIYDIMTEIGDKFQPDLQSSLQLEFEWRKMKSQSVVLLHDPPSEAKATVRIQITAGNTRSPAFSVYQELAILRAIVEGLATTEVNWIGTQDRPLVEAVQDLVEQLKLGSDIIEYRLGESTLDDEYNTDFNTILLEERKDLDFTDHLWKILQHCTSYSDLVKAFTFVVSVLRTGELQPFIHNYNTTMIAQMVKDSYQGQLRTPTLSGLNPLQYLAEIGMQKLTHDYIHIFMVRNLTSYGNLDYFVKGANLEFDEKLERLGRLQNVLEVVIMLKQCLNLPQACLTESTRQMLKHYESHQVDPSHHFVFPVPTSALSYVVESYPPSEWKVEEVKMVEGVPERLSYNMSSEQPFDWLKLDTKATNRGTSSGDTEEHSYFLTVLKDSVSILC